MRTTVDGSTDHAGGPTTDEAGAPQACSAPDPAPSAGEATRDHGLPCEGARGATVLPPPWQQATDEVVTAVVEPGIRVVDLLGAPGSGRSTVLRQVIAELTARGSDPLVVRRHDETTWLPADGRHRAAAPEAGWAGDGEAEATPGARTCGRVVVADDADQLPARATQALSAAAASGAVVVVATTAEGEPSSGVAALRREHRTATVRIEPFDLLDVLTLVESLLGAPVEGPTAARVQRDTGGRPALVAALCRQALSEGVLSRGPSGRYRLVGDPPVPWALAIAGLVETMPAPVVSVLRLLAVADAPVPRGAVERLTSTSALARARRTGVVTLTSVAGTERASCANPWLAAGLRAELPEERRRELRRRLGEQALAEDDLDDHGRLQAVRWLVAAGALELFGPFLERAVSLACRHGDSRLAGELRQLAASSGQELGLSGATVDLLDRRPPPSHSRSGRPLARETTTGQRAVVEAYSGYLASGDMTGTRGRPPASRVPGGHAPGRRPAPRAAPGTAASLQALRAMLLLTRGRTGEALAASASLPLDRVETLSVRLISLIRAGRSVDAVRLAQRLPGLDLGSQWYGPFRHVVYSRATLASAYAGGWLTARNRARRQYESALLDDRPVAASPWAFVLGDIQLVALGDVAAAKLALRGAAELMDEVESGMGPVTRAVCLGELSITQALTGEPAAARDSLTRALQLAPAAAALGEVAVARSLVASTEGDPASAAAILVETVSRSVAHGSLLDAVWAGVFAAGLGRSREVARSVEGVGARLQGPVPRAMYDTIHTLAGGSRSGLDRLVHRLDRLGFTLLRSIAVAARGGGGLDLGSGPGAPGPADERVGAVTTEGTPTRLAGVRRALPGVGGEEVPGTAGGTAAATAPPVGLTARQQQVALLVADGLSNADVAARLGISRRTVEVHLQIVYGKLGLHDRRALATSRHLLPALEDAS